MAKAYRYESVNGTVHVFGSFAELVAFAEAAYSAREGRPITFEGVEELEAEAALVNNLTLHEIPPTPLFVVSA